MCPLIALVMIGTGLPFIGLCMPTPLIPWTSIVTIATNEISLGLRHFGGQLPLRRIATKSYAKCIASTLMFSFRKVLPKQQNTGRRSHSKRSGVQQQQQ